MSKRPKMLASTIRELIAPALRTCPKECGIVSIVDVQVSTDYSYVTVYVSALQEAEKAVTYLERHVYDLQKTLGSLHRKRIPQLRFRIDPHGKKAGHIDELLDTLS